MMRAPLPLAGTFHELSVAVDDVRLAEKLPDLLVSDPALRSGTPLRGGIRLIPRNNLEADTLDRLQSAGVTQPVFRHDGAILVAGRLDDAGQLDVLRLRIIDGADSGETVGDHVVGEAALDAQDRHGVGRRIEAEPARAGSGRTLAGTRTARRAHRLARRHAP